MRVLIRPNVLELIGGDAQPEPVGQPRWSVRGIGSRSLGGTDVWGKTPKQITQQRISAHFCGLTQAFQKSSEATLIDWRAVETPVVPRRFRKWVA